jgi:hypothetical protein
MAPKPKMGLIIEIMLTKKLGHYTVTKMAADKKYYDSQTSYQVNSNRRDDSEFEVSTDGSLLYFRHTRTRNQVNFSAQNSLKKSYTFDELSRELSDQEKLITEYRAHHPLMKWRSA